TRSIDISYGRLLFPALIGFAPLLAFGLRTILRWFAPLLIVQLALFALFFALEDVPRAYPHLDQVAILPADTTPVNVSDGANASGGGLTIVGDPSRTQTVAPGGGLDFDVYLTGTHDDNPALFLTVLDPLTEEALPTAAVYPGGAATDTLPVGTLY